MQFRTQIPISKSNFPLDYTSVMVSLGSCFAVNMAEQLDYFKFQNTVNPFGILFHPLAIERFIDFTVSQKVFTEKDIFFHNERWHSFDAHSDLSNSNKEALLQNLNQIIEHSNTRIKEATHLIITLGTAWVYRKIESDAVVANCHKVPQKQFEKELLSVDTIKQSLESIISLITSVNKEAKIIFTVSPVRHIKDGFVENQWSKANLISAIHQTISTKKSTINYFPSYEIMMDELRDYRFYAEDMLHPNQIAIDYIWQRFKETWIAESVYKTMDEVDAIQKGLAHRPFNPKSESHLKFEASLTEKKTKLVSEYPFMKF
ncbi:GSCFA domain-containing protein [Flavobacterium sp.]|uniref:GSCFA domain-containing protein n=1 Tax=Flavobacterium sp. TaxID=239 RepID=UPI002B4B5980|nr:GSCFA domain-containing protein [Flavobacterium sp.]HLF52374.1 GSCFA domain-containing protein [Flavobacterium sp.]